MLPSRGKASALQVFSSSFSSSYLIPIRFLVPDMNRKIFISLYIRFKIPIPVRYGNPELYNHLKMERALPIRQKKNQHFCLHNFKPFCNPPNTMNAIQIFRNTDMSDLFYLIRLFKYIVLYAYSWPHRTLPDSSDFALRWKTSALSPS